LWILFVFFGLIFDVIFFWKAAVVLVAAFFFDDVKAFSNHFYRRQRPLDLESLCKTNKYE